MEITQIMKWFNFIAKIQLTSNTLLFYLHHWLWWGKVCHRSVSHFFYWMRLQLYQVDISIKYIFCVECSPVHTAGKCHNDNNFVTFSNFNIQNQIKHQHSPGSSRGEKTWFSGDLRRSPPNWPRYEELSPKPSSFSIFQFSTLKRLTGRF